MREQERREVRRANERKKTAWDKLRHKKREEEEELMEENVSYTETDMEDTRERPKERGRRTRWNDRAVACFQRWVKCKRSMVCLAIGIICFIWFFSFDHTVWGMGKASLGTLLDQMLQGQCRRRYRGLIGGFFDKEFFEGFIPAVPQYLSGLQL